MITKTKKKKLNPMLLNVLLISGGIHVAVLLVLGSITVYNYIIPDEAAFEEPPAVEEVEPPKDVKVEIRKQPPPQQQAIPQLRMKQVGNIAVASVDVNLPSMDQSFTVSSGIGNFGGGSLLGGTRGSISIGMSDISVFGLDSKAERVLFVIDASETMLTDEKGGFNSYRVIKDEIVNMVGNLSAGTLFNVIFYDDGRFLFFKPELVPAGTDVKREFEKWSAPINSNANSIGLQGAQAVELSTMPADHPIQSQLRTNQWNSGNETAYLSQVFLEQTADAIFIITPRHSGFEGIRRNITAEERREWDEKTKNDSRYMAKLNEYETAYAEAMQEARAKLARENAARKAKG